MNYKKYKIPLIIGIIVIIIAVLLLFFSFIYPHYKEKEELNKIINEKAELKKQINSRLDKLNYCEKSEDCTFTKLECPFGCAYVNVNADTTNVKELIKKYNSFGFSTWECNYCFLGVPDTNVQKYFSCLKGKCVYSGPISSV